MATLKKISIAVMASAGLAAAVLAPVNEASAREGRNAALFGGLAAGAVVGGGGGYSDYPAYSGPAYYGYETYDAPVVVRHCYRQRQAVFDDYGQFAGYRRVKVCDWGEEKPGTNSTG